MSSLTMITINSTTLFDTELSNLLASTSKDNIFIYLTGAKQDDGKSWCCDSEDAEYVVLEKLYELSELNKNLKVLYCTVNKDEYKNNENYYYRKHELLKLKAVPTLYKYKNNELISLVETDCSDIEKLNVFCNL